MADHGADVESTTPPAAWDHLKTNPRSALVDVRSRAEWTFVGMPDLTETGRPLLPVEWASYPDMTPDPAFASTLADSLGAAFGDGGPDTVFFLCRSGARSASAASVYADYCDGRVRCVNVEGGFEGDRDAGGHRGTVNGWKVDGLPWRQG